MYACVGVFVGKIFGVKSVIVLGGVDIANNKELNYGIWLNPWKAKLVRYALRHADRVLVGDLTMKKDAIRLAVYPGQNIVYVPPGYDPMFWKPVGEKEPFVLTVAAAQNQHRLKVKGITILVETARKLPDTPFVVIGVDQELAFELRPPVNVTFHPIVPRKELLSFYRRAKVYCQPSLHEAVCYTVREAMLCGCIPVASEVGGMPTAVAGVGILVAPNDVDALATAIQEAMDMPSNVGEKARARIVALYPQEKRELELVRLIDVLLR